VFAAVIAGCSADGEAAAWGSRPEPVRARTPLLELELHVLLLRSCRRGRTKLQRTRTELTERLEAIEYTSGRRVVLAWTLRADARGVRVAAGRS